MEEFNFDAFESYAKIVVIGVGGAGSNAVNQMIDAKISNIDFWVCNTDAQALSTSKAEHKFVLGSEITSGLGAGGDPEIGRLAAEASQDDIKTIVTGANIVFVAAGMGGGTGTGAAPIICKIAKDAGALTVAIVTRPFGFEGKRRIVNAVEGISKLKENVDAYIIVSNDKCMLLNGGRSTADGFKDANKVLMQSVKTITDLITIPGLINLDFKDVKNVLSNKGLALIGYGYGKGEKKAVEAATAAISSPLAETSITGAKSALINITIGKEVTMFDIQDAVTYITEASGSNANIILGVQQNDELKDEMFVAVVATEFDEETLKNDIETQTRIISPSLDNTKLEIEADDPSNIIPKFMREESDTDNYEVNEEVKND